jgi:hypothetical protein
MNKALIWVGVGVVGVGLAALMVPWGRLNTPPTPEILVPEATRPSQPTVVASSQPDEPQRFVPTPLSTAETNPEIAPIVAGESAPKGPSLSAARQDFAELQKRPDIKLALNSEMKWQAITHSMAQKPRDPAADHAMERANKLRAKLREYHADPASHDINELMAEQEHIIGQMRQTRYWDKEFQSMEADLETQWESYRQESGAKHPYR